MQAWTIRRAMTEFNTISRRPHYPREWQLRHMLKALDITLPEKSVTTEESELGDVETDVDMVDAEVGAEEEVESEAPTDDEPVEAEAAASGPLTCQITYFAIKVGEALDNKHAVLISFPRQGFSPGGSVDTGLCKNEAVFVLGSMSEGFRNPTTLGTICVDMQIVKNLLTTKLATCKIPTCMALTAAGPGASRRARWRSTCEGKHAGSTLGRPFESTRAATASCATALGDKARNTGIDPGCLGRPHCMHG